MNINKIITNLEKVAMTCSPVGGARIASCITIRDEIISYGINRNKTHPFQKRYGRNPDAIYIHAEIDAIRNAIKQLESHDLSKCSIFIVRMKYDSAHKKNLIRGLAKPCRGCQSAISAFQVKQVFYTDDEGHICNYK